MRLNYTQNFRKNYKKRISNNPNLTQRFKKRLELFLSSPSHPLLRSHKLAGAKKDLRSFSVAGDIRVIYYQEGETIYLVDIGSHNQVY
ncbi:MAG: type II toxin-antitoxin system mRNA interferase toxin, RelE/StbE family [bacterium]|nr:type II toxin-antitoxin system mRNA interferase toxin, RelE/StbE family [bacterium]